MKSDKVFIVRAVALTGRIEVFSFTSKSAAGIKVRELKDEGGYIITQNELELTSLSI